MTSNKLCKSTVRLYCEAGEREIGVCLGWFLEIYTKESKVLLCCLMCSIFRGISSNENHTRGPFGVLLRAMPCWWNALGNNQCGASSLSLSLASV